MAITRKGRYFVFESKENKGYGRIIITSVITSILIGFVVFILTTGFLLQKTPPGNTTENEGTVPNMPTPQLIGTESENVGDVNLPEVAKAAKSASPGVVGISLKKADDGILFNSNIPEQWGIGTGVIVSSNGYILTNHHVAGGEGSRLIVSLSDGRNVEGICTWSEQVLDIAIVKVDINGLIPVVLGNSDDIIVGETAIAIGNPLGLQFQRSVTAGVVSALNRTVRIQTEEGYNYMEDLIQTDASINPGNSGGPLLNSKGEVIGINTVKVTSAEGIGFAVPINVAVPVIRSFVEKGDFRQPYLGVFAYDKETIPYLNNINVDNGIYVVSVDEYGPAYAAGIREGYIIEMVDGKKIDTMLQLRTYVYSKNPGDTIRLTVMRKGENSFTDINIQLDEA